MLQSCISQRGGVGPRYTSQPTSRPRLRASPPAARTRKVDLRPSQRAEDQRALGRARHHARAPCPSHAEPQQHPGLGRSRRRPARSPRRGGAARGGAATTWHRLSFPASPHGRGRAAGRAPRRSRAQRGGGGARTATRGRAPRLRSPVYPPGGPSSAPWSNVGLQALMSGVFRDRV